MNAPGPLHHIIARAIEGRVIFYDDGTVGAAVR